MGFLRDAGAALTMGISATTKHKEAEAAFNLRETQHQNAVSVFNDTAHRTSDSIDQLAGAFDAAREALIANGALTIDEEGNVNYGWYRPVDPTGAGDPDGRVQQGLIGSIPAFGVAIGAPALTWTLVGAFATASTGTAISALSGAAASMATAAWIGRAATFGLMGASAGRVALGPIALVSLPLQAGIGAKVAGNNERKAIRRYDAATAEMERLEGEISNLRPHLTEVDRRAVVLHNNLNRHTSQLETAQAGSEEATNAITRLDADMRQSIDLFQRFAEICTKIQQHLHYNAVVPTDPSD